MNGFYFKFTFAEQFRAMIDFYTLEFVLIQPEEKMP